MKLSAALTILRRSLFAEACKPISKTNTGSKPISYTMRAGHDDPPAIAGSASGWGMSRQTAGNVSNVVYARYTRLGDNPTGGMSDFSSKEEIGTSKEEIGTSKEEIGIEVASALLRRGHN
jgi:hypothetical protein